MLPYFVEKKNFAFDFVYRWYSSKKIQSFLVGFIGLQIERNLLY